MNHLECVTRTYANERGESATLGEFVVDGVDLYSVVCWHDSRKRQIRVSMLRRKSDGKYVLLFSTDPQMDAFEVVSIYRSRFQVEFLFREGKQELGLADCQGAAGGNRRCVTVVEVAQGDRAEAKA